MEFVITQVPIQVMVLNVILIERKIMTNEVTFEDALNDTEAAKVFIEQQKKLIDNIENQLLLLV